ncbi:urea ABC transporter substrate-binding protein [Rubellicoccus peritrichatus]|uniref:Urea ABC transporter substrate-binding protein n=1 Tax=Rubellicoccus peritrichatus TaxID=3080537 RepID=A0AAQ3QWC4_9BACT|nr:urea ABC transporter substrate-binding protein [Puniceicoccus sp. CR14]WOO42543.1 urea ABC transporter substrate-binding protein [Puniceicoccus sp. CR14]
MVHRNIQQLYAVWLILTAALLLVGCDGKSSVAKQKVKVGVLHSQTGTMRDSEKPVLDATLMAIDEINEKNLIPGIYIEAVVEDGASNPKTFARKAEKLIRDDKVVAIFGGWTSASRKAIKPIVERYDSILLYPVQYEGVEESPNIIYLGAAPNQQIIPAVYWAMKDMGKKRFFLVGSDYIFPHTANEIIKDQLRALGGEVVGESYIPLGSKKVEATIDQIVEAKPDIILNTLNGDTNKAFFQQLRDAGINSDEIPTISFSIGENEVKKIGARNIAGDYLSWNYFQSIDTPENKEWVRQFGERYGENRVTSDPMEAAYSGVYLWASSAFDAEHAVEEGIFEGQCSADGVRAHISGQSFKAPSGLVFIHPENHHLYKTVRIGKIGSDGQIRIVWTSDVAVRPEPYPVFRTAESWKDFVATLNREWGGSWSAPAN